MLPTRRHSNSSMTLWLPPNRQRTNITPSSIKTQFNERAVNHYYPSNMKVSVLTLLLGSGLLMGCAGEFQSAGSESRPAFDPPPDTNIQDSIDRTNQQMAMDAANAAAQQQFNAAMAAAQQTMNDANND